HSEKPGSSTRRNPRTRRPARYADAGNSHGRAHRRHARARTPRHAGASAAHSGHYAGIPVHFVDCCKKPRSPEDRRIGHRGRNPRGRGRQARRAPGAVARTPRPSDGQAAAAHRSLRDAETHRTRGRFSHRRVATGPAHHGSLSRNLRLAAERKLKAAEIRALVATASLELGIDIGSVDLVCQIGSPRSIAAALQRIGRAGHWRGAIPKGRFFVTTRDDLLECAALVRAIGQGDLDRIAIPEAPMDILAQQIVAMCAAEDWKEEELFQSVRRAYPYRNLSRADFDEIV